MQSFKSKLCIIIIIITKTQFLKEIVLMILKNLLVLAHFPLWYLGVSTPFPLKRENNCEYVLFITLLLLTFTIYTVQKRNYQGSKPSFTHHYVF